MSMTVQYLDNADLPTVTMALRGNCINKLNFPN